MRKRNGGIIYGDQIPHRLPDGLISTTNTKFVFQLIDGQDVRLIGDALFLNPAQREFPTKLPPRHCVLWSKELANQRLLLRVLDLDYSRHASTGEIALRMKESVDGLTWTKESPAEVHKREKAGKADTQDSASRIQVSKMALDYLCDVAKRQFLWMKKRDASLKLSAQKADNVRKELLAEELVVVHVMKTGERGGRPKLIELTKKAKEFLLEMKVAFQEVRGKGSFLHVAAQYHVAMAFRQMGKRVLNEDNGCDVSVDGVLAVEILVSGVEKELWNIERDLQSFKEVLCVCDDREKLEALREKVEKAFPGETRVKFSLLARFLNE